MTVFTFKGIYTPLVTPLNNDGSVRWDGLADVIEYLISKKVHGLITGGQLVKTMRKPLLSVSRLRSLRKTE